jgi:hypothetical protein
MPRIHNARFLFFRCLGLAHNDWKRKELESKCFDFVKIIADMFRYKL